MRFLEEIRKKDASSAVAFHLEGLLEAAENVRALLAKLDGVPEVDQDSIAETITYLQVEIYSHLAYHMKKLRRPLRRLEKEAYRESRALDEHLLRDFFLDKTSASALLEGVETEREPVKRSSSREKADTFQVDPTHLVRVCDAFLQNHLKAEHLRSIGICLFSSDRFSWNETSVQGEKITAVAGAWVVEGIRDPINRENVEKWRRYLLGAERIPAR